jgi:hypothetical protein
VQCSHGTWHIPSLNGHLFCQTISSTKVESVAVFLIPRKINGRTDEGMALAGALLEIEEGSVSTRVPILHRLLENLLLTSRNLGQVTLGLG